MVEENPALNRPKRSVLKTIRKIFFSIFLLLIFFILSAITLLFIYEDEVKAAIVSELNKHLKAEVKIDPKNIDLTIIKTFPDCSVQFRDLLMLEALPIKNRDTLLFAGRLNLLFNIKDLWNKKYEIEKIKLKDGIIKLKVLKNGKTNYIFWKTTKQIADQQNDSIHFDLKLISIENCRLNYKDKKNLFKTDLAIKTLNFKGHFAESDFELESDARIFIHELVQGKVNYLENKQCDFKLALDVNDNAYTVKKAEIDLNQLTLKFSGNFNYKDSLEKLDLKYSAPDLDISSLLSLLPEKHKGKINDYESKGNFYAEGTIRYADKNSFSVVSDFGIKNGNVTYKPRSTSASNVNIDGHLNVTNASSFLGLKNIRVKLNKDEIKGSCTIKDFSQPYIQLSAQADVLLENLQSFWPIDTISSLKGNLHINTEIEGLLSDLKDQAFSSKVKLNLEAKISNLEARFKNDEKLYAVENCVINAKEREIEVRDLKLKRGESDLKLNGRIPGMFNYLVDRNSPLVITGSLYSNYIRMEDFMGNTRESSGTNNSSLIPSNVNFKLNAAIVKFSFGKFEAQSITGEIEIKDQKAIVSDMKLETMHGEAEIDAFADNSKNRLDVTLQSNLKNIYVADLFSQLNNFGQAALTDKNIKGSLSADIEFSGSWNNSLVVDPGSILATCNLAIEKGELIDFKPLLSLSKFVDVEDLRRIKFSSLQSMIEIKNSTIIIPKTSIKNSALDIEVWGTHTFDNKIDYHIQLLIDKYLAKKRKNKESEFGPVESDPDNKRSAFILMTGTLDDPHMKYDTKGLKEKIKNDIRQENKNIRQLLKEEWNLFKKDSTLKKVKKQEPAFELEKQENNPPKKTLELKRKKEEEDF
jgi:hypothetical protein